MIEKILADDLIIEEKQAIQCLKTHRMRSCH